MFIGCKIPARNYSIAYTVKKQSHSSPEGARQILASKIVEGGGGFEVMNKLTGGPLLLCCLIAFLLGSFSKIWHSVFIFTPLSPLYSMYLLSRIYCVKIQKKKEGCIQIQIQTRNVFRKV